MHEVKKFFKPEFLNRLHEIIVFHYLEETQVPQIVRMFVNELAESLNHRNKELDIDDKVFHKLAHDNFDPVYGARSFRREVKRQIKNPLAMRIIKGECSDCHRLKRTIKNDKER